MINLSNLKLLQQEYENFKHHVNDPTIACWYPNSNLNLLSMCMAYNSVVQPHKCKSD
jgi:hypothetical protein